MAQLPILPVLLPLALEEPYAYLMPSRKTVQTGTFVRVPLGSRMRTGVIWGPPLKAHTLEFPVEKLRKISAFPDVPPLTPLQQKFVRWVSEYTLSPPGMVLRMVMSVPAVFEEKTMQPAYKMTGVIPDRMTAQRQQVLDILSGGQILAADVLKTHCSISDSVLATLVKQEVLEKTLIKKTDEVFVWPEPVARQKNLSNEQKTALLHIRENFSDGFYATCLLDGVTGSGKTEVYFELISDCLKTGKQTLVLLPEITLTGQFTDRFRERFGFEADIWHSAMTSAQRRTVWKKVITGRAPVIIGARSALFLPFRNPGLMIVDEEHETAYKQEDGVRYQARDMAVVKAHMEKIPLLLCSATPSLESWVNAKEGRYHHVQLKKRFTGSSLPEVKTIDLRQHPPDKGKWISPVLLMKMQECLEAGRQSLLFLSRRGYAPLTLCRTCGLRLECPNCSTWLVEHRFRNILTCHHCGHEIPVPAACPECEATDSLVPCGPGVERISQEVEQLFPQARIALLSSDLLPSMAKQRAVLDQIIQGKIDIIVGTQLIAKGHHFPKLKLVGVVDGDLGLSQSDPRAGERTFQLISQVAGRAGREKEQGYAFIQTYMPEHPLMQAIVNADRDGFLKAEIKSRKKGGLPPFGRLAALIISSGDVKSAHRHALHLVNKAPKASRIKILGPAEAPIHQLRGRYRYRILLLTDKKMDLQAFIQHWLSLVGAESHEIQVRIDIDPYSFY